MKTTFSFLEQLKVNFMNFSYTTLINEFEIYYLGKHLVNYVRHSSIDYDDIFTIMFFYYSVICTFYRLRYPLHNDRNLD